ncbi:MAG: hypothetical protein ABIJ97_05105 [Bacteroidota bacterium]
MKKFIYLSVSLLLVISISCKKKDSVPPTIFLLGADPFKIVVESNYTDPGVTANDNCDGKAIVSKVSVSHNVPGLPENAPSVSELIGKVTTTGPYKVTYSVVDDEGNVGTKDRNVVVFNEAEKYAISYYTDKSSQYNMTVDYSGILMDISFDTKVNNRISFPKLSNVSGLKINGDIYYDSIPGTSIIKKMINIPLQQKEAGSYIYKVQGIVNESEIIDTIWYTIKIEYQIDKYENNSGAPGALLKKDNVVETYERL